MTERPSGLVPGSGRRGSSRALDQVISARFPAPFTAKMRRRAEAAGIGLGDWLRIAASRQMAAEDTPVMTGEVDYRIAGWSCAHVTMTAGAGVLSSLTSGCGCDMQPVYAAA